jgi:hypothetical protein
VITPWEKKSETNNKAQNPISINEIRKKNNNLKKNQFWYKS